MSRLSDSSSRPFDSIAEERAYWEKYIHDCHSVTVVCMVFGIGLLLLLQAMTYILRVHTGGDNALLYAVIPFAGPIFLAGEMLMQRISSAWILVCLLIPCLLNLVLSARYHDRKSMGLDRLDALESDGEDDDKAESLPSSPAMAESIPVVLSSKEVQPSVESVEPVSVLPAEKPSTGANMAAAAPKPTPLPEVNSPVKPTPLPKVIPPVKPSTLPPVTPGKPVPMPEKPSPRPHETQKAAAVQEYTLPKTAETQKAEEEYQRALQDVLSLLNK